MSWHYSVCRGPVVYVEISESGSTQGTAVYIQLSSFCSRLKFHFWILQYNRLKEKFAVISSMTLCIPVQIYRSFRGSKCETGIGTVLTVQGL